MKKRIAAVTVTVLATAGVVLGLSLSSGSTGAKADASLPALTTVPAAYTVPGTLLTVSPQPASALSAKTAKADATVDNICATPQVAVGCYNSTPASIQYILFSDHHDPSDLLTNEPAYLLQWPLTGRACYLGLGGAPQTNQDTLGEFASCTYSVAVDAASGQQIDSWEN